MSEDDAARLPPDASRPKSGNPDVGADEASPVDRRQASGVRQIIPRATYRLQLHAGFGFEAATRIIPYLARLGVSHLYCSPYFRARAGSTHGYDVVDHSTLNPELGTREDFDRFLAVMREHGLAQILDIVPNHVGVMGADNAWWMDVLENGPASMHAEVFDIDWEPADPALAGKLLVPVLGDMYGRTLERGEIVVRFERETGSLAVFYHEHRFPLDPREYPRVLTRALEHLTREALSAEDREDFTSLVDAFARLPSRNETDAERIAERQRDKEVQKRRLLRLLDRAPPLAPAIQAAVDALNRPDADALHDVLEAQAWRLAYWRVAPDEINYRRFFDVNDLAALRMENDSVFDAAHALAFDLVRQGAVEGLRIDHPDGLYDPARYFARLRARVPETYVVAEKITAPFEDLPAGWPVQGSTGYRFTNVVNGLFVDPAARARLERVYRGFVGEAPAWQDVAYEAKRLILGTSLASELNVLANQLTRLARADRGSRDFTLNNLRRALIEVIACFPVYRTYIAESVSGDDRRYVEWAVSAARRRGRATDAAVFDFVRAALLDELPGQDPRRRRDARAFAMKFQQVTAPVTAKGVEDTALYRFVRMASANEVGGDPASPETSVAAFHADARRRAQRWPHEMLTTSTHDTKRSEDVRARIDVLSEMPGEWRRRLERWSRFNRSRNRTVDEQRAPSQHDEYLLYQTLVGTWPLEPHDAATIAAWRERIEAYAVKAAREAKLRTSWFAINAEYEDALTQFIRAILDPREGNVFLADLAAFAAPIARLGLLNSLSQTLLRLTAPGTPDTYQGTELWDFSLVDPDNRRPVDYALRARLLDEIEGSTDVRQISAMLDDPKAKLFLIARALRLRRDREALFRDGEYIPLNVQGARAEHVVAFARRLGEELAVTVAPRLYGGLMNGQEGPPLGEAVWADTRVELPQRLASTKLENVLGGASTEPGTSLRLADVLVSFPVALLATR